MATVNEVLTESQSVWLGDADGDLYTPTFLLPYYAVALREAVNCLSMGQAPQVRRVAYAKIDARTRMYLRGGQDFMPGYSELISIDERPLEFSVAISSAAAGSPPSSLLMSTASAHGRSMGDVVQLGGMQGIRGAYGDAVVSSAGSPTSLTVQVYTWGGTYTANSGALMYASGGWSPVVKGSIDTQAQASPLRVYDALEGNVLRFPVAAADTQLRLIYHASAFEAPSLSDEVAISQAATYLAVRTAMIAADAHGAEAKSMSLAREAWGVDGTLAQPTGGALNHLMQHGVRMRQAEVGMRPVHWSRAMLNRATY